MAISEYQEHWSILKGNMNLRLENISKAQIQPSKRSNILEILQKAGLAEEAYSTVNPVMLQWLVSIKLGNPSLSLCTSNFFSPYIYILESAGCYIFPHFVGITAVSLSLTVCWSH